MNAVTAYSRLYLKLIADNLRRQLGLADVSAEMLNEATCGEVPQPLIIDNENGRMWLDRYYAAFQVNGGRVHYVYISKHHIAEEVAGYKACDVPLPLDIRRQFAKALASMKQTHADIWIETNDYSQIASSD